ncbi:MAG: hypothetical protein ACYDHH_07335 [Solirubrobacteraceae bacterium]
MTHACCPACRLRFNRATAAHLTACPACGGPLKPLAELDAALGFRLFQLEDASPELPEAIAVSDADPDPGVG